MLIPLTRPSRDSYFIQMLRLVASRSTCLRRSVAAIITDEDGHVLSTGYNGVPRGFPHCIDSPCGGEQDAPGKTDRCLSAHAEQNALLQCSRLDRAATLYVSVAPCFTCAKLIANTNIKRVVYSGDYADERGRQLLERAGVECVPFHTTRA